MFAYNGVYCEIVDIPRIAREVVTSTDGVDYLYTHWIMDLILLFHRSYVSAAGPSSLNPTQAGLTSNWASDSAASALCQTDAYLRNKLLEPRQKLKLIFLNNSPANIQNDFNVSAPFSNNRQNAVQVAAVEYEDPYRDSDHVLVTQDLAYDDMEPGMQGNYEIYLESPLRGMFVDSNNGPHPIAVDIREILGQNALVINYRIETWLNEMGPPYNNQYSTQQAAMLSLLSNRYNSTHVIDTDGLCTKVTTGEARFRTDLMEEYGLTPDHFRNYLFVPIAPGMKRENIEITQPSVGNVLLYKTTDREKSICLNGDLVAKAGATRVDVQKSQIYGTNGDLEQSAFRFSEQLFNIRNNQEFYEQAKAEKVAAQQRAAQIAEERHAARVKNGTPNEKNPKAKGGE